jgi:DNA repair protein RadC
LHNGFYVKLYIKAIIIRVVILKPSRQDEELTSKIKEAGKLLDIQVLDRIIVTKEGYFSFADEGLL